MTEGLATERAYTLLRGALLDGRFSPRERLVELALVEDLGVNRATIREALARLEQEGLVERRPNRGAVVRALSPAEIRDILRMRIDIEGLAARWASERGEPSRRAALREPLDELVERATRGDIAGVARLQARIHHDIVELAGSEPLRSVSATLDARTTRIRRRSMRSRERLQASLSEHERIVVAVVAGDADAAERAMRDHLRQVNAHLLSQLADEDVSSSLP